MKQANATYPYPDIFGLFDNNVFLAKPNKLDKSCVLFLWGGEDVSTHLYNEKANKYCTEHPPTKRDLEELQLIQEAINLNIPIIGICRGAQLLCIHQKGTLLQHIFNHNITRHHSIFIEEKNKYIITNSIHHQMMIPNKENSIVLAYADNTIGIDKNNKKIHIEKVPEVILWPQINALGIQGHPEYLSCPSYQFFKYCKELIVNLIKEK